MSKADQLACTEIVWVRFPQTPLTVTSGKNGSIAQPGRALD